MCSLCTLLLAQQNVKAAPKNLGGSDRPDIHQTALLPFKLKAEKKNGGGGLKKKTNTTARMRVDQIEVGFNW